jgi:hypothetical protein
MSSENSFTLEMAAMNSARQDLNHKMLISCSQLMLFMTSTDVGNGKEMIYFNNPLCPQP